MEKQEQISEEMLNMVKEEIGDYNFAYSHNGGSVFIFHREKGSGNHYEAVVKVCVLKYGKALTFSVSEHVGNDAGTVFTYAMVSGIPQKKSRNDGIGLYPYGIFLADEKGTVDTDIMEHAAEIFKEYDEENPANVQIGKIFRSYVPMSYKEIKARILGDMEKSNDSEAIAKIAQFNQTFRNF